MKYQIIVRSTGEDSHEILLETNDSAKAYSLFRVIGDRLDVRAGYELVLLENVHKVVTSEPIMSLCAEKSDWRVELSKSGLPDRAVRILYANFTSRERIMEHIKYVAPLRSTRGIGVQSEERIMRWLGME